MGTILKIAYRNLKEHKLKTWIVGILIFLSIALTFVVNSFFESSAKGVKKGYSENFTGDMMLLAKSDKPFSLFGSDEFSFGGNTTPTPVIQRYDEVYDYVKNLPELQGFASQVSGFGFINLEERGQAFNLLFGVDADNYFSTFKSIRVVEGRMMKSGESAIMMSKRRIDQIAKENKVQLKIGDSVLLNSFSKAGLKIRAVPLVGIYEYLVPTQALEVVSFIDVQTLRALNAMTVGTTAEIKLDGEQAKMLTDISNDDFFGETTVVKNATTQKVDLDNILGDKGTPRTVQKIDNGSWHFIPIRLKSGSDPAKVIERVNKDFEAKGWNVKAVDWKAAAGLTAALTGVTQFIFNVIIVILAIVAIIIIINTQIISVMERTSEIGTMRALGAQKSFVRSLFVSETMLLAGVFGAAGIVVGSLIVALLGQVGIVIDNDFLQILFGARDLHPELSATQITSSLILTLFIGLVSWIYPVMIALKVSPLKAIASE